MRSVRNKYKVRKDVKIAFVKKFSNLFELKKHSEVVRLARRLIGYSPKTIDNDIYVTLWHSWKNYA